MKKIFSLLIVFLVSFVLFSCTNDIPETETESNSIESIPILGVEIRNENEASFYALTKSTTYTWKTGCDEDGNIIYETVHDGVFCLDMDDICVFTRNQIDESILLKFSGDVLEYKIYSAEISQLDGKEKSDIIDEKYLISSNEKTIRFKEYGEYYFVVDVKYQQGEVSYGFILSE